MSPDDCLRVELPRGHLDGTVSDLLDRAFPADEEGRRDVSSRFDLRDNPDLPEIYAVFLAACEEWRDWRCALLVSAGDAPVELDAPAAGLPDGAAPPVLALRLEQQYRPLEYAVRHGFWPDRGELLDWMRSLATLYFIDKHEAVVPFPWPTQAGPTLARALSELQAEGIIAPGTGKEPDGAAPEATQDAVYVITREGRRLIAALLGETETYIDTYDHYQDTLADPDRDVVEFGTGRGLDLRVEAFLAEDLDPVRTVFLLRLYDGSLDERLADWMEAMESEELFAALLQPVVNRHGVEREEALRIVEHGYAWLEERQEQERRDASDRDLLRQAGDLPD